MSKTKRDERVVKQIGAWRDDLINLTRRNALLYYKPTRSTTFEFSAPDVVKIVDRLLRHPKAGWGLYEPPEPIEGEGGDEEPPPPLVRKPLEADELLTQKKDARSLQLALRGLGRRANQEYLDKGLWVLYLGAGMLYWEDPETNEIARSPLVLYPVVIEQESPKSPYRLVIGEDDAVANPALAVKLDTDFGITLPPIEDPGDLASYLSTIGALKEVRSNGWRVEPEGVVRTFSFHKEVMYRDLQVNEAAIAAHPVARALALGAEAEDGLGFDPIDERELDAACPPEELTAILDADATQRTCLAAAALGHSFVMDGPPGTGKSQTIANLIASSIGQGKTVLFVSEKAAALEVVSSRLDAMGLGEYLLELHSHKATRKQFAHGMAEALGRKPVPPRELSGTELGSLKKTRVQLSNYAEAMNQIRHPIDQSVHDVLGRISQLDDAPEAPVPAVIDDGLSALDLNEILRVAGRWSRAWGPVERGDEFLWAGTKYVGSNAAERQRIEGDLDQAAHDLEGLSEASGWIAGELNLPIPAASADADLVVGVLELCDRRPIVPKTWLTTMDTLPTYVRITELKGLCQTHNQHVGRLVELVGDDWESLDPEAGDRVRSLATSIRHSSIGVAITDSSDADDLAAAATALDRSIDVLDEIIAEGDELREALVDESSTSNFRDTRALASVAALIGDGPDPDEKWLDSLAIYRARESARALEDAVEDFRSRREDLGSVFDDDVLDLDVEALAIRYEQVHRGIRKLSSAYRDDKRTVAGVSRTGKASREVTDRLSDAVEWQLSRDRWRDTEESHEDVVGDHYYRADKTDFAMIEAALLRSETILATSCDLVSARGLREHFSVQCDPSSHLKTIGIKTLEHLDLLEEIAAFGGIDAREAVIADVSPQEFRDSMAELVDVVRRLIADLERVGDVAGQLIPLDVARDSLHERKDVAETLSVLQATLYEDELLLGSLYQILDTDWDALEEGLSWTAEVRALLDGPLEGPVATRVLDTEIRSEALRPQAAAWEKSRKAVSNGFDESHRLEVSDVLDGYFDGAREYLAGLQESIDDVGEWAAFHAARSDLEARGLGEVTAYCVNSSVDADQVVLTVERAVLVQWVDKTLKQDKRLKPERRKDRGAILREFRDLDRMMAGHAVARVIRSCNAQRPSMAELGGAAVIKREGMKKTRHRPIRTLMADARDVIQAVKPCFMMSPLTVSQYLDPETRFDLVIFDEASQVLPADAVNCIYRGKQVVIAGDQKQLPPTTFFQRMGDDDESAEFDEDDLDQFESILDIAKGSGLTSLPLLWHYRSRHESLITYSNFSFYGGDLVTYPSATDLGQDIGIELFKVDGIYRRGTSRDNPVEAEKVTERVIFHARNHPELTVGVVAFSEAQASLIQDVVDETRRDYPELDDYFVDDRLSGFFVKNLENVQGDERDIMIFSIGYGPDEMGAPVKGNFGPLTRAGGERRLNVAITRARRRVEVVSSIDSSDFKSSWKSAGARHLKRYLDFANRGMPALALDLEDAVAEPESPFEEDVLDVIRSWGYEAVPQVGTAGYRIDMGVRDPLNPGTYAIGIECDGAMYHSSRAARDRDRLRQEVLEGLGWTIYRIWGTSWYRSRNVEERLLREAIEAAIDSDGPRVTLPTSPEIEVSVVEVDHSAEPDWTAPYELATLDVPRHLAMSDGSARPQLQEAIRDVVYVEGPVTEELTLGRIREAWGVGRAGRLIREAFHGQLRILQREGEVTMDRRRVLWWTDLQDRLTVRTPVDGDLATQRKITQVPREELQLAIVELLRDAISADRDELTLMVSKLFGWRRRGSEISTTLDDALVGLLRGKRIVRDGDQLRVGQPDPVNAAARRLATPPEDDSSVEDSDVDWFDASEPESASAGVAELESSIRGLAESSASLDSLREASEDTIALTGYAPEELQESLTRLLVAQLENFDMFVEMEIESYEELRLRSPQDTYDMDVARIWLDRWRIVTKSARYVFDMAKTCEMAGLPFTLHEMIDNLVLIVFEPSLNSLPDHIDDTRLIAMLNRREELNSPRDISMSASVEEDDIEFIHRNTTLLG